MLPLSSDLFDPLAEAIGGNLLIWAAVRELGSGPSETCRKVMNAMPTGETGRRLVIVFIKYGGLWKHVPTPREFLAQTLIIIPTPSQLLIPGLARPPRASFLAAHRVEAPRPLFSCCKFAPLSTVLQQRISDEA
jgi:hypothetical protein